MNLRSFFKQKITLWQKSTVDGYGKPSFLSPVEVWARWQDQKTVVRRDSGIREIVFGTVVYSEQIMAVGDYVALGEFTGADPLLISTSKEVKTVSTSSDISGRTTLYSAFLKEK